MTQYLFSEITGRLSSIEKSISQSPIAAGMLAVPSFIDTSDGGITILGEDCLIHDNPNNSGELTRYSIPDGTFTLTEGITTYIVVNYNAGSPIYQAITDVNLINESDVIPVFTLYNENNQLIHKIHWNSLAAGTVNKLNMRFVKTDRFGHESGLALGEDGTNRYVTISSGKVWTGAVRHELNAFNSNTDRWLFWSYDGTSWSKSVTTSGGTYNNTQYQSPTGLAALGNNEYGVVWVFRDVDDDPHAGYILGNDSYHTLAAAAEAPLPSLIPAEFSAHGMLVGRIIIQEAQNVASQIDSAFENPITNSPVTDHQFLSGIQGSSPYYHSNQMTDTTSVVEFDQVTAGENWILWATTDTGFTAELNKKYLVNTSSNTATLPVTLPSSPSEGDTVEIVDAYGNFGDISPVRSVTIQTARINGINQSFEINIDNAHIKFVWHGTSLGWKTIV